MARVPYVGTGQPEATDDLAELFREIADLRGSVHHLHRALANQPSALRAFMGMSRYIRNDCTLSPKLRELAVLATAYALDVEYEKVHHRPAARRAGVSERQIAAFPNWEESDAFEPAERAVLRYADQVARTRDADDATFRELRAHLSTADVINLALTVGWYHLCAAILGPLRIEPET